jgi:hypothetical protein
MSTLFLFFTTLLPKAGAEVSIGGLGIVPLTVSLVLFPFLVILNIKNISFNLKKIKYLRLFYIIMLISVTSSVFIKFDTMAPFRILQTIVLVLSPLVICCISQTNINKSLTICCVSLFLVGSYAFVQFYFGILNTAIEGITYTAGQSLTSKMIGIGQSLYAEAFKMPSTYQNGNSMAIFVVSALTLCLAWKPQKRILKALRLLAVTTGTLSIFLCGARAVGLPFLVISPLILSEHQKNMSFKNKTELFIFVLSVTIVFILYLTFLRPDMFQNTFHRMITRTLGDPTGVGRTIQWANMNNHIRNLNDKTWMTFWLIGTDFRVPGGEGVYSILFFYGLPAAIGFAGCLVACVLACWRRKKIRGVAYGLTVVCFDFLADLSFYYPPSLMIFFIIAPMALYLEESMTLRESSYGGIFSNGSTRHNV